MGPATHGPEALTQSIRPTGRTVDGCKACHLSSDESERNATAARRQPDRRGTGGLKLSLSGHLPDGTSLFAAVDPEARLTGSRVEVTRFGAYLAPFQSVEAAQAALGAAGATLDNGEAK